MKSIIFIALSIILTFSTYTNNDVHLSLMEVQKTNIIIISLKSKYFIRYKKIYSVQLFSMLFK